jgi:hypothetical protein
LVAHARATDPRPSYITSSIPLHPIHVHLITSTRPHANLPKQHAEPTIHVPVLPPSIFHQHLHFAAKPRIIPLEPERGRERVSLSAIRLGSCHAAPACAVRSPGQGREVLVVGDAGGGARECVYPVGQVFVDEVLQGEGSRNVPDRTGLDLYDGADSPSCASLCNPCSATTPRSHYTTFSRPLRFG